MNKEEIIQLFDNRKENKNNYQALKRQVSSYVWWRHAIDPRWQKELYKSGTVDSVRISVDNEVLYVSVSARACGGGCCGYDYDEYEFPIDDLSRNRIEIQEEIENRIAKEESDKKLAVQKQEIFEKQKQKERDRAELNRLLKMQKSGEI